jgi:hypothetical protein
VTVQVGATTFDVTGQNGTEYGAAYQNESGQRVIKGEFSVPEPTLLRVAMSEYPDGANSTFTTFGYFTKSLTVTETLTQAESQRLPYYVNFTADVFDADETTYRVVVGRQRILPGTGLDELWRSVIGVGLILMLGGLFGGVRAELGAVVVATFGAVLWFIGWLPAAVGGGAVVLALLTATLAYARSAGGPTP